MGIMKKINLWGGPRKLERKRKLERNKKKLKKDKIKKEEKRFRRDKINSIKFSLI